MHWPNLDQLSAHDEVKFVINDRADFDYACEIVRRYDLASRIGGRACFRRCTACCRRPTSRAGSSRPRVPARLQIQAHKYIWEHQEAQRASDERATRAVVLLSGGLDSATAAALARREGWALYGLTVRYGQVHACETRSRAPRRRRARLRQHIELDIDLRQFGGSSLVGDGEIPDGRTSNFELSKFDTSSKSLPPTSLPATPSSCRWRWPGPKRSTPRASSLA